MENNSKNAKACLAQISQDIFLAEPFMYNILCTHKLVENTELITMFRTGRGNIEYNPAIVSSAEKQHVTENLKAEILRIVLKHPYQRVPSYPNCAALTNASDITLNQHCRQDQLKSPDYYNLDDYLSYEEYYSKLKYICPQNSESKSQDYEKAAQQSALWENNEMLTYRINGEIEKAQKSKQWGSISGHMKETIIESTKLKIDYRHLLTQFKTNMLSQHRTLTRMKPIRRYGYEYMGNKIQTKPKLMVGLDVSGSVETSDLTRFLHIINRFFSCGIESIMVVCFDTEIKEEYKLKKATKNIEISGRGGTNFQPLIDRYLSDNSYQGLIIFTDGYADVPVISKKKDILWMLTNINEYNEHKDWIKNLGCKVSWIPKE